jgi:hypothetical protein
VNPWPQAQAQPSFRGYYWTLREGEYATDLLFRSPQALAEIYPFLARHAIEPFDSGQVLRFLGRRTNLRFAGEDSSDRPVVVQFEFRRKSLAGELPRL